MRMRRLNLSAVIASLQQRRPPAASRYARQPVRTLVLALALSASTVFCLGTQRLLAQDSVPAEVASTHFVVSIHGHRSPVVHAATNYFFLNFDVAGPTRVSVTASDRHFWDRGVEIRPIRLGLRPVRHGATITFTLRQPEKLSISRPGDHFSGAEMLFLFANTPQAYRVTAQTAGIRFYGPGVHREDIEAASGDRIYLARGAVIFGSLNLWQVHDVRIFGGGTVIYDGPQNPLGDEGWMHKRNWHCIVMDNATNIEIDGITCVTRSRSWQIQMKDSRRIGFYNVKVIGGNPNNANQDGMDWLGGGDTTVQDSFFRASDDVFAMQGNWEGYEPALLRKPGHDVTNITIDHSVLSTSISNTVRAGWPEKTFNSANFHMSDVDVIHTGFGGCKVPFAFFELWADPDGHGRHEDYRFRNIRLEDWYSLLQIRQPAPEVRDVTFDGIWTMDGSAMVSSVLLGDVSGVALTNAAEQGFPGQGVQVEQGAAAPVVVHTGAAARFTYTGGLLRAGRPITFTALAPARAHAHFFWLFGDGTRGSGATVRHTFTDTQGTLLDGSGRFRVTLHTTAADGAESWRTEFVVLAPPPGAAPSGGIRSAEPESKEEERLERVLRIPADGGYTLTLLTSTKASISVDGGPPALSPAPQPQVCGSPGNAVQPIVVSAVLKAGEHRVTVLHAASLENVAFEGQRASEPLLLIEGPGLERQPVPPGLVVSDTRFPSAASAEPERQAGGPVDACCPFLRRGSSRRQAAKSR